MVKTFNINEFRHIFEIDLLLTSKSTWHIVLAKRGDPIIRPPRAFKGFFQRTMKGKSKII